MFHRLNKIHRQCAAATLCVAVFPCCAEAAGSPSIKDNLTPAIIKHTVECPAPNRELCVIKKPVGTGYRPLTLGINLEDAGENWIADFTKAKLANNAKVSFRIIGKDNDIHDIEVSFKKTSAAKAKPAPKKTPPLDIIPEKEKEKTD